VQLLQGKQSEVQLLKREQPMAEWTQGEQQLESSRPRGSRPSWRCSKGEQQRTKLLQRKQHEVQLLQREQPMAEWTQKEQQRTKLLQRKQYEVQLLQR
jgi:GH24 family phage-related lysozyme (muramidase)